MNEKMRADWFKTCCLMWSYKFSLDQGFKKENKFKSG